MILIKLIECEQRALMFSICLFREFLFSFFNFKKIDFSFSWCNYKASNRQLKEHWTALPCPDWEVWSLAASSYSSGVHIIESPLNQLSTRDPVTLGTRNPKFKFTSSHSPSAPLSEKSKRCNYQNKFWNKPRWSDKDVKKKKN